MKVYVLLKLRTVGDHFNIETVEEFEAIFETREAAENAMQEFKKTKTIIRECEVGPSKVYALISISDDTLQGIFATELGAEQARGKRRTRTTIEDWEVEP